MSPAYDTHCRRPLPLVVVGVLVVASAP